eukprot:11221206-Alexandrium_andersonii.AAC.1
MSRRRGPPTGRRGPSAAQTPYEFSARPRLGNLRGERYARVLVDERVQVSLADVDEQSFPGSRAPPACAGLPARGKV